MSRPSNPRVEPANLPPRGVALALAVLDHLLEVFKVGPTPLVSGLGGSPWSILLLSPFLGLSSAISCSKGLVWWEKGSFFVNLGAIEESFDANFFPP